MNAETARRSVRPGDVVVVDGEQFDLPHSVPVAAVYPEGVEEAFAAVSYGPDGVGELVDVRWDSVEEYHPNENTEHPSIIAHRLLEENEQEADDDQEGEDVDEFDPEESVTRIDKEVEQP